MSHPSGSIDEPIYAAGGRFVVAMDAAGGAVLWKAAVGGRFGTSIGTSLMVAGDLLLVGRRGEVMALDRWTGATRWQGKVGGSGIISLARAGSESDVQTLLSASAAAQAAAAAAAAG